MNNVYKISIGQNHGLLINNGNLYSWGKNDWGQLGITTSVQFKSTPKLISNSGNWTEISAGINHSLGICGDNLYAWGSNETGQLGLTAISKRRSDFLNDLFSSDSEYNQFKTNVNFIGNTLYGSLDYTHIPTKVGGLTGWEKVEAGDLFSYGIRNGFLYAWGCVVGRLLIDGDRVTEACNLQGPFSGNMGIFINPKRVHNLNGWSHISAGKNYALGIRNGYLYSWGPNTAGVLGRGNEGLTQSTELIFLSHMTENLITDSDSVSFGKLYNTYTPIPGPNSWSSISASEISCLGISGGHLYAWGDNFSGIYGNGTRIEGPNGRIYNASIQPFLNKVSSDNNWKSISCGRSHCLGLKEIVPGVNELYSWGRNFNGQLGNGTIIDSSLPLPIDSSYSYSNDSISAKANCSGGIENFTGQYETRLWGFNPFDTPITPNSPVYFDISTKIPNEYKQPNSVVEKISAGWRDLFLLRKDTTKNVDHIPMGPGKYSDTVLGRLSRDETGSYTRVTDIAAGFDAVIAARKNNTIEILGVETDKQYMSQATWDRINTKIEPIIKVLCGVNNFGVIFADGYFDVWGRVKQLPMQTPFDIDWKQAVSGGDHVVILTNSGNVYCFGDNTHGQCSVPPDLTEVSSIFATPTCSGAVKNNGDVVYWGNTEDVNGLDQNQLFDYLKPLSITNRLPKNKKYKDNLIGYTFDGNWGESLFKDHLKTKIQEYYNQIGEYPEKLILNISDNDQNSLRWFNEPANIKYLGYTLNSSGLSLAGDGVTYQNVLSYNFYSAPVTDDDFNTTLYYIKNFYNLGYTLAKQAIFDLTGNKESIAVGFNVGSLLPNYTNIGFSGAFGGYTFTHKLSWQTGNTLINYREYSKDESWTPYITQGVNSYLPINGFDISYREYKPYSEELASKNYYLNSIGITSAVYTKYYDRWKQFLQDVNYDFIVDNNISKFILPEEISNTPIIWKNNKKILKDYENITGKNINKVILSNFSHNFDINVGFTYDVVTKGPVLVQGATGILVYNQIFKNSIDESKTSENNYNTSINNISIFDNSILAILGNTFERKALDQWYYYGILGGTYYWNNKNADIGFTAIDWSVLQTELINEDYSVFNSSKPNTTKLISLLNYFNNLITEVKTEFNFYDIKNITKIKSGKDHSILLDKLGTVYFLGSTLDNKQNIPAGTYIDISAGDAHSAAIDTTGKLFTAGKIITDSGGCSGSTLTVNLTSIEGMFDTVESGGNHLVLFETGENKKYLGRVDRVDDIFKRIYVKSYSAPNESPIQLTDPSGTNVSVIRDGSIIKNIQHKLLSVDSYMNSVQYIVDGAGNIQDPTANNGSVWKTAFINAYQTASGNDLLITPYKQQQAQIQVTEIKYLNNNKLYEFEKQFKNLVQTENKIDIRITDL